MIIVIGSVFILIALLQIPGLIRQKLWRELAAFSVLLSVGFALSLLLVIGVKIPSPNQGIIFLIKTVANLFR